MTYAHFSNSKEVIVSTDIASTASGLADFLVTSIIQNNVMLFEEAQEKKVEDSQESYSTSIGSTRSARRRIWRGRKTFPLPSGRFAILSYRPHHERGLERGRLLHHGHLRFDGHGEEIPGSKFLLSSLPIRPAKISKCWSCFYCTPHWSKRSDRDGVFP